MENPVFNGPAARFTNLSPGTYTVTLEDIPTNCELQSTNPVTEAVPTVVEGP